MLKDEYGVTPLGVIVVLIGILIVICGGILLGDYLSDGEIVWSYEQDQSNAQQEMVTILKTQTAGCNDN